MARIMTVFKKGKELKIDVDSLDFLSQVINECKKNDLKMTEKEINETVDEIFEACVSFGIAKRII